jgi:hypothetical protein
LRVPSVGFHREGGSRLRTGAETAFQQAASAKIAAGGSVEDRGWARAGGSVEDRGGRLR